MYCTICAAKTKALIRCAGTAQLICVFVFAYAKDRFSHDAAQVCISVPWLESLFPDHVLLIMLMKCRI